MRGLQLGPAVWALLLVFLRPVFSPGAVSHGQSVARATQLLTNVSVPLRTRFVANASNHTVLRFQLPSQCSAAAAAMPSHCPVDDVSYCDEFLSLDGDCSQSLSLQ